jgi:hypothetical protein
MQAGELTAVDCDHCNRCVAEMANKGVACAAETKGLRRKSWPTP